MIDHEKFLEVMNFPKEWIEWNMLPPELVQLQVNGYEVGHENSSEHDRNGAFHWWLKKKPQMSKGEINKLYRLTFLDPDQLMASDVRRYIEALPDFRKPDA